MATDTYDAIVIGAGQAGGPLASALAKAGRRTAIIEREHVGGTCVNEGCTPTKTMVASARVAYLARRAADYGVQTGPVSVDMTIVRDRKRSIVESFRSSSKRQLDTSDGVDLLMGAARFVGPKTVEVTLDGGDVKQLDAEQIFINVGARPANPPIDGLDSVDALNSTTIMELDIVPEHLLVLGGGYIGVEFGQMFRRFGSAVTVVQRGDQLLNREDKDVADSVAEILRNDGITVLLDTSANKVVRGNDGAIVLTVSDNNDEREIIGSHLLVAIGRQPNSDTLNLQAAGVATDKRGNITVNERLETNVPGIYVLGDVKGGPAFTHISYDDFRIIRTNLIDGGNATTNERMVPYTVFMDPQLGRVGMSETEAREVNRNVKVAKIPMEWVARAIEVAETRGLMKAVVDADTEQILGCAILGLEGGEIMGVLHMAMMGRVPYTAIRDGVFAHPTLTEALNNLFGNLE